MISWRICFAKRVLMVWPGRDAMMRPLRGRPMRAMSPMMSSSLWRAGSFSNLSGVLEMQPNSVTSRWGSPIRSEIWSRCSCDISRSYITMALSRSPPFMRLAWRRASTSRTNTNVREDAMPLAKSSMFSRRANWFASTGESYEIITSIEKSLSGSTVRCAPVFSSRTSILRFTT